MYIGAARTKNVLKNNNRILNGIHKTLIFKFLLAVSNIIHN